MRQRLVLLLSLLSPKRQVGRRLADLETIERIQLSEVVRNIVSLSLGSAIAQMLMAASFLLMSRHLGSTRLGQFASSFSAAGLSAIIVNWGLDSWLLQSAARHEDQMDKLLANALSLKGGLGLFWLIGMVAVLPRLNPDAFSFPLVLTSALAVWTEGILNLILAAFKALLRNTGTALMLIASRSVILLSTLLLIVLNVRAPTAFALIRLGSAVGVGLIALICLPFQLGSVSWTIMRTALRESTPFAASDLFASIYARADMTIAAVVLGAEQVGMYAPAAQLIGALFVFPGAWYFVAVPVLTRMSEEREAISGRVIIFTVLSFAAIGSALWLGTWSISSLTFGSVLGSSFGESGHLLGILSPIAFLKSCSFGLAAILVSVGWQSRRVYVQVSSAIINVVLNLALVRRFGIASVAAVYVLSEIALMLGYLILVALWTRRSSHSGEEP